MMMMMIMPVLIGPKIQRVRPLRVRELNACVSSRGESLTALARCRGFAGFANDAGPRRRTCQECGGDSKHAGRRREPHFRPHSKNQIRRIRWLFGGGGGNPRGRRASTARRTDCLVSITIGARHPRRPHVAATGTRLGPDKIVEPPAAAAWASSIGRATTKLGRDVRSTFSRIAFASDLERLARFQREAEVLASLNHPHIARDSRA